MQKHAYLIMAHKNDLTFDTLISLLDDPRNDIFIHMDLKNKAFKSKVYKNKFKHANVYLIPRKSVTWGGYSQIEVEIDLIESAFRTNEKYSFYHLLSGEDLPIKSQDYIHNFFNRNSDKNFVHFDKPVFTDQYRVRFYHLLQESVGRKKILGKLNKIFIYLQKTLGIHRNKQIGFQKGANWFSINDDLSEYILDNKDWIAKVFKYTRTADEVFLQTLVHNSSFKLSLYNKVYDNSMKSNMRFIDWNRGNPYTFKLHDYQELMNSKLLFARKFNAKVDSNIILKISDRLSET